MAIVISDLGIAHDFSCSLNGVGYEETSWCSFGCVTVRSECGLPGVDPAGVHFPKLAPYANCCCSGKPAVIGYVLVSSVFFFPTTGKHSQWSINHRFLPESIRWMLLNGRVDDLKSTCKFVPKINRLDFDEQRMHQLTNRFKRTQSHQYTIIDCFRTKYLRLYSIALSVMWYATLTRIPTLKLH